MSAYYDVHMVNNINGGACPSTQNKMNMEWGEGRGIILKKCFVPKFSYFSEAKTVFNINV